MGTFLVLDIPKVPSDSTIWELHKSIFGIFGIKNLSRLDSRDMCMFIKIIIIFKTYQVVKTEVSLQR